uniref:MULE transposase domain-containing protein n=1 Tax=Ditylenchus dipsaci TaxID=166011 RepID=A0A915DZN5_9BILA
MGILQNAFNQMPVPPVIQPIEVQAFAEENVSFICLCIYTSIFMVYAFLAERSARISNGGKYVFPVLYAFLENKSAASYTKMFNMVKVVWPAFAPTSISMDFEKVAIQSAIDVFPGVNISGCLFHLVKNFKKQMAAHGLSTRSQEPEFSLRAKMLMSLAFVPPENIRNDFRLLKTHLLSYDQVLAPVINWFLTYYVGMYGVGSVFDFKWYLKGTAMRIRCFQCVDGYAMKELLLGKTERITLQKLLIADYTQLWAWIIQMWLVFSNIS